MPETMPIDQPVRVVALPAEQAATFRAAARAAVERDPAALAGAGADVHIAVPAEGEHQAVSVEPGQTVVLEGEAFRAAVYVMQPEGLVVLVGGGGTLLLPDLTPTTPIVIDGLPPILAAEMAAAPAVQPEAGQASAHGGGAGFAGAEAASMGSGLDALGPLAATAQGHAAAFGDLRVADALAMRGSLSSGDGGGTGGGPGGGDDTDHGGPGGGDDDTGHGGPGDDDHGGHSGGGDDDGGPGPIANARPLAGDDRVGTDEDRSLTIRAADLLGNDGDADGNPLRITAVDGGRFGEAVLNPDGSITFTPRGDFNGEASFRYTVSDGQGGSDRATVRVDVRPVNDAPLAADDALRTDEDRTLRIEAPVLLGNDRDVDGDPLRIVGVGDASHGKVVLSPDGSVAFTPDADFHGQASFTYTVGDGKGGFDTAVARIEVAPVNDEPVATDDRLTTAEDTAIRMARGFFTGDDIDADGDPLRIVSVQKAEHGTVELTRNHVVFTPDADFHGQASFTYTISDGHGGLDTATVRIQVDPVNDAPVGTCDNVHTDEDTPAVFDERRLSSDDHDVDGDRLRVVSVQDARHGTVSLAGDGTITFTPDADFSGEARFTYTVSDGKGGFDTAGVTVHVAPVNDAPVLAVSDWKLVFENSPGAEIAEVAATDKDSAGPITFTVDDPDFEVVDNVLKLKDGVSLDFEQGHSIQVTVTAADAERATTSQVVRVSVINLNDAPEAIALSKQRIAENAEAGTVVGRLSVTDQDAGDRHTFEVSDDRFEIVGKKLVLKDGVVLDHEAEPQITLQVTAHDHGPLTGGGASYTETFVIEVRDRNEAPVAEDAGFHLAEGLPAGSLVGRVAASDPDSPSKAIGRLTFAIAGGNEAGLFTIDPTTGDIFTTAALDHEAVAEHRLEVTVADRSGNPLSDSATITVTVDDVDEAPTGAADLVLTNRTDGGPIEIPEAALLRNDSDPEGGPLHIAGVTGDAPVSLDGAGSVVLDPLGSGFAGAVLAYDPADAGGHAGAPVAVQVVAVAGDLVEGGDAGETILGRDGAADDLRGGGGDDWLVGRGGDDQLDGGDGKDHLDGGAGKDRLAGGRGQDDLRGGGGDDLLLGEQGNDDLRGGAGKDVLDGGLGADLLDGGAGDDVLTGGAGSDRFRFSNPGGTDRITDFQAGTGGDVIDLRSVLSGVGEETGAVLQNWLRIEVVGDDSTISIDADGTGDFAAADARIVVEGVDLMGGAPDQAAAIDSLVANGNVQAQQAA